MSQQKYNAFVRMDVFLSNGYVGDYRDAIDEAVEFSKRNSVPVKLVYANQVTFFITPEITDEKILNMKNHKIAVGV